MVLLNPPFAGNLLAPRKSHSNKMELSKTVDLNEKEVSALLAYLRDIAASGKGDPRTFTINNNGTIQQ